MDEKDENEPADEKATATDRIQERIYGIRQLGVLANRGNLSLESLEMAAESLGQLNLSFAFFGERFIEASDALELASFRIAKRLETLNAAKEAERLMDAAPVPTKKQRLIGDGPDVIEGQSARDAETLNALINYVGDDPTDAESVLWAIRKELVPYVRIEEA